MRTTERKPRLVAFEDPNEEVGTIVAGVDVDGERDLVSVKGPVAVRLQRAGGGRFWVS